MHVFKELEVVELKAMLDAADDKLKLVDVRNPAEMSQGSIPGSENVPLHLIPLNMEKLKPDHVVVLYCQVGARSSQACAFLAANGYDNVHNLRGGIQAWMLSGLKVARCQLASR